MLITCTCTGLYTMLITCTCTGLYTMLITCTFTGLYTILITCTCTGLYTILITCTCTGLYTILITCTCTGLYIILITCTCTGLYTILITCTCTGLVRGNNQHLNIYTITCCDRYQEILQVGYSIAMSPRDEWQCFMSLYPTCNISLIIPSYFLHISLLHVCIYLVPLIITMYLYLIYITIHAL